MSNLPAQLITSVYKENMEHKQLKQKKGEKRTEKNREFAKRKSNHEQLGLKNSSCKIYINYHLIKYM